MQIGPYRLRGVQFPDPAGEHQRRGATASLIRELGDNYSDYHAYLADEIETFNGPPKPADFADFDAYAAAWSRAQALVMAEAFLRNCKAFRRSGRPLDAPLDPTTPLLDHRYRLVGVE
jgi:hypothetical protein